MKFLSRISEGKRPMKLEEGTAVLLIFLALNAQIFRLVIHFFFPFVAYRLCICWSAILETNYYTKNLMKSEKGY